jgi:hypothetical protein
VARHPAMTSCALPSMTSSAASDSATMSTAAKSERSRPPPHAPLIHCGPARRTSARPSSGSRPAIPSRSRGRGEAQRRGLGTALLRALAQRVPWRYLTAFRCGQRIPNGLPVASFSVFSQVNDDLCDQTKLVTRGLSGRSRAHHVPTRTHQGSRSGIMPMQNPWSRAEARGFEPRMGRTQTALAVPCGDLSDSAAECRTVPFWLLRGDPSYRTVLIRAALDRHVRAHHVPTTRCPTTTTSRPGGQPSRAARLAVFILWIEGHPVLVSGLCPWGAAVRRRSATPCGPGHR